MSPNSPAPIPIPHREPLCDWMVSLSICRDFPLQPFSSNTKLVLFIAIGAQPTCTHTHTSYLLPSLRSCSHHEMCSNNKITILCISWHLQQHFVRFPQTHKYSVMKVPLYSPEWRNSAICFQVSTNFTIFHFVLWTGIRPGFPQMPRFHSSACLFFHLWPHVSADKWNSDTHPA